MLKLKEDSSKREITHLDHLGIVAGVCDEIGLSSHIDRVIPSVGQRKVSMGTSIKAMILNGLGFAQQTLYLSHDFYRDKPISHLLGAGMKKEYLTDDCLGDALDAVYKYGVNKLFFELSYRAVQHYNIPILSKNLDGTSLLTHGESKSDEVNSVKVVFSGMDYSTGIGKSKWAFTKSS